MIDDIVRPAGEAPVANRRAQRDGFAVEQQAPARRMKGRDHLVAAAAEAVVHNGRDTLKPSAEKLKSIADVLGVTTEYLLDENADMDDKQLKEAFFRKFNRLEEADKQRIQDMIDAWGKKK